MKIGFAKLKHSIGEYPLIGDVKIRKYGYDMQGNVMTIYFIESKKVLENLF